MPFGIANLVVLRLEREEVEPRLLGRETPLRDASSSCDQPRSRRRRAISLRNDRFLSISDSIVSASDGRSNKVRSLDFFITLITI